GEGFDTLVESAGPVIEVLGEELPRVGLAVKIAMEQIADGSEGGADALQGMMRGFEALIVGAGATIGWLEKLDGGVRDTVDYLRENSGLLFYTLAPAKFAMDAFDPEKPARFAAVLDGVTVSAGGTARGVAKTAQDLEKLQAALNATAVTADSLA